MAKKHDLYPVPYIEDLRDLIVHTTEVHGDRQGFLKKENGEYKIITHKEYYSHVRSLGTYLHNKFNLPRHKIALVSENRYEWTVAYLAVVVGGGIIVPIDKELPHDEICGLITASGADVVICSAKYEESVSAVPSVNAVISMDKDFYSILDEGLKMYEADNSYDSLPIDKEEMCAILYTSGTTGDAKGVMLSQKNIATNLMNMGKQVKILKEDVFLCLLPLHHTYECTCGFLYPLYAGASVAFCEGLKYVQKNMVESKTTIILGVPAIFENMYNKVIKTAKRQGSYNKMMTAIKINNGLKKVGIDLSKKLFAKVHESFGGHMRILISGAAAIDPVVAKGFRDLGILFLQGYGLTECAPIVGVNRDVDFRDDSAGMLLYGMELRIDNPDDEGNGEIVVKGDNVMLGYYENPEQTAAVLKDGWFHTGDIGHMDENKFIYITGRKKNVIIASNGKNVFPEEIEGYLYKHAEIKECVVTGRENEKTGDTEICAEIFPNFDLLSDLDDEAIMNKIEGIVAEINETIPLFKRIRKIHIRKTDFEKTTTLKIKRHKI